MTRNLDKSGSGWRTDDAVVAHANWYQFGPGESVRYPRVESRMVLWCKRGRGTVTVNRQPMALGPGEFVVLPWRHAVAYEAAARGPFLVAGVHVIPRHARGRRVVFEVAHARGSPLAGRAWREDVPLPGLPSVPRGRLADHPPLAHVLEYTVACYVRHRPPREEEMRLLGRLVLDEVRRTLLPGGAGGATEAAMPAVVRTAALWVRDHPHEPADVPRLAAVAGCSPSTLQRAFRRHLRATPLQWVARAKVERAAELLRSTRMPVAAVATAVGIADPFYFSRWFRRLTGESPRDARKRFVRL
ncbi:MAG TPA: AraC family transcriptional regulator [Tepidisphaeraceae bacterium]|nr:AraC family transcriptional regulator [Tepidisphaeraceae bacterium]